MEVKEIDTKWHDMPYASGLEYNPNLIKNDFFDKLLEINHNITVPEEYRKQLEDHVCMCGKLIFTSFLPEELQDAIHAYSQQKSINTVVENQLSELTKEIDSEITKDITSSFIKK